MTLTIFDLILNDLTIKTTDVRKRIVFVLYQKCVKDDGKNIKKI